MTRTNGWMMVVLASALAVGCSTGPGSGETGAYRRLEATVRGVALGVDVYFPEGLSPGDPVLMQRVGSLTRARGTIGADGVAALPFLCVGGDTCTLSLAVGERCAILGTPADGGDVPGSGDVLIRVPNAQTFCQIEAEAPTFVSIHGELEALASGRIDRLVVQGAPIQPASFEGATVHQGETTVSLSFEGDYWGGALVLDTPLEPNGELILDLPAPTNAVGDPAMITFTSPLYTSAVVTDLSFADAPVEGSVATFGYPLVHESGALILRDEGRAPRHSAFAALIALGDPGAATTVRWSASVSIRSSSLTEIALYREGGRVSSSAILTEDGSLTVPAGEGALWVSLTNPQQVLVPVDVANPEVFALQELILE